MSSKARPDLFDMELRALRRARAKWLGPELFLHERAFDDCLERILLHDRRFERALLIGGVDATWATRLGEIAPTDLFDEAVAEDGWQPPPGTYDLVVAIGTLDSVNDLPRALLAIRRAMRPGGLFIGAMSGGNTLPQLRAAMRAADAVGGVAFAHVHPRIEPAALAPLLEQAGFGRPVVDVDRVQVSYPSLTRLVGDLRRMAATNLLRARPRFVGRAPRAAAERAFAGAGDGKRTVEMFEILHFASWTPEG
jgi:SAM-dependent methyltransferase